MHNFMVSDSRSEYNRVVFCTWCGVVVWHFNRFDDNKELQERCGKPCIRTEASTARSL